MVLFITGVFCDPKKKAKSYAEVLKSSWKWAATQIII